MAKVGDTVRFLNATGGGKITKIVDKVAYVEEDGFETPVLLKEIVVVMPAGHEPKHPGAKLMFDQAAYDKGKQETVQVNQQPAAPTTQAPERIEETAYGDKMNIVLAFEPSDIRRLSQTTFNAVLVNDSNYFLKFTFLRRSADERDWSLAFESTVAPNELIDLEQYTHETISGIEHISVQFIAYKKTSPFELKQPVSIIRRLDLTKFHKLHCFRPDTYFDTPVLEFPLVSNDIPVRSLGGEAPREKYEKSFEQNPIAELSKKYKVDAGIKNRKTTSPASNPHKLLPLQEIDLHIEELIDSTAGMQPADMLQLQLDTVRKVMKEHARRLGQKIVFIHGKGDGVLRKELLKLLKKEYPKAETQDASFQEYGFGATLVTIH